ncbi:sugar phosphate isomerase/epimerase family protein [Clostridium amylolyticum]|nr:sugar phosphate isomerase/epimerase family protein [Clostridium amylolyticum]
MEGRMLMRIGIIHYLNEDIIEGFKRLKELGFESCQLVCWDEKYMQEKYADLVNKAKEQSKIDITAFWCGWPKPVVWDFYEGPITLGLVPAAYRSRRTEILLKASDFAKKIQVKDIVTHVGFLPEDPNSVDYRGVVSALKVIADYYEKNQQNFLFETGQETPTTLLRCMQDIGRKNLGVNLDPANLLLYGKANPIDALDILGEYIKGVHGKDGEYPTDGAKLGQEKPLGEGRVDFPKLIHKLKTLNYTGDITIENEINDNMQLENILKGKKYLELLVK